MADRLKKLIQKDTPYFDLHFACWANNHGGKSKAKRYYKKRSKQKEKRFVREEMEADMERREYEDTCAYEEDATDGRWEPYEHSIKCSICGFGMCLPYGYIDGEPLCSEYVPNYCPACGEKMAFDKSEVIGFQTDLFELRRKEKR